MQKFAMAMMHGIAQMHGMQEQQNRHGPLTIFESSDTSAVASHRSFQSRALTNGSRPDVTLGLRADVARTLHIETRADVPPTLRIGAPPSSTLPRALSS